MRRVCYLHIGLQKTGTTAIQHVLRECIADFASGGFFIPQTGFPPNSGGHNRLAMWLGGDPQFERTGPQFAAELGSSSAEAVVISSELIARRLLDRDFVATLFNRLSSLDLEPRVIMAVRNQPQLFNSAFSQLTKAFRWTGTFREFVASQETTATSFNMRIADAVTAHGAPLTVLPYNPGIVSSFLAAISAPAVGHTTIGRINQSAGPFTIEVARTVQRGLRPLTAPEATECWRILRRALQETGFADTGYCGLTTQAAREIETMFADHNNAFAARVWGRLWADLFASEVGLEFEPNDYQITGVPPSAKPALERISIQAKQQCEEMLARSSISPRVRTARPALRD